MVLNRKKFESVLLYILKRCGSYPQVGKTVIYKLLYFSDFNYYELYEKHLTGEIYRKIDRGPAPCNLEKIADEMIEENKLQKIEISLDGKKQIKQIKYLPLIDPDLSVLNAREIKVINDVISEISPMNASQISAYSHGDMPWKATGDKEIIDYELVFYRDPVYSVREYENDEE
ncbi:hypothetical protein BEH94_09630 [Candidatus Altiarchaeales archaeon WOR_SM1_SCG]|nr:hypothetical protein BEH94_09630 [Candidatus Altiarchaeales archaeon WOR_SM1_SCG]